LPETFPYCCSQDKGKEHSKTHVHSPTIRRSVPHARACLGPATSGCTQTENKLAAEMKRNGGASAGSFSWMWFD